MSASLHSRSFGILPSGNGVEAWTLEGSGGLTVEALTYGGIVTRLLVPDQNGTKADVVLGFDQLEGYLEPHPYFGAIVGRVAGRMTGDNFSLDGANYNVSANDGPNHLHGGRQGFDKRLWSAAPVLRNDGAPSLRLKLLSPDGDQGYPGALEATVTYTVSKDNAFIIEATAATDKATPVALTHHSYFNLAGEGSGAVEDHTLAIFAEQFVPNDDHMTLLGRLEAVQGGVNDFCEPRSVMDAIPGLFLRHGSLYRLPPPPQPGAMRRAARLAHGGSGRTMDVSTTESYLQFYSGAFLDGSLRGKSGATYAAHSGVCLECQGYPDGANAPQMDDVILRPGSPRSWRTEYAFSAVVPTQA